MTEFGNIDLIEERTDNDRGVAKIRLPGVVQGDMATRSFKPEIRVFGVVFSPTGNIPTLERISSRLTRKRLTLRIRQVSLGRRPPPKEF